MESTITKHDLMGQAAEYVESSGFDMDGYDCELMEDVCSTIADDANTFYDAAPWSADVVYPYDLISRDGTMSADLMTALLEWCDIDTADLHQWEGYGWYRIRVPRGEQQHDAEWVDDPDTFFGLSSDCIIHNAICEEGREWELAYLGDDEEEPED